MADVEVLMMGNFDETTMSREFDAISFQTIYWRGLIRYRRWSETDERIYVYSDRNDPLGDDYAMKNGKIDDIRDDITAKTLIAKAVASCFDHTTTVEVLPDGIGGWIPLETDT